MVPPKGIYSHISGIDLVQSKDDNWYILEDNLRVPSGASYPMIAREFQRKSAPAAFLHNSVIDNRNYAQMLKSVMDNVNTGGINVILSPGRYNAAFFEHSYLAERTGAVLTTGSGIPFYSMLAVLWCIHPYTTSTLAIAKQRTIGTFLGAAYGLVFLLFSGHLAAGIRPLCA